MREVVVAQFERAGIYHIWQRSSAFDDIMEQMLITVNVTGEPTERKSIDQYELKSYRPLISESREINGMPESIGYAFSLLDYVFLSLSSFLYIEYRGLTFGTNYNQEKYPFPNYSVGNINGKNSTPYDIDTFDIGAQGGTCGIWVIRSMDTVLHPFHIVRCLSCLLLSITCISCVYSQFVYSL